MAAEHANPARAIYGTILVMAVITALSHDDSVTSAQLIAGVLVTTFVFWIAHVYAEIVANNISGAGHAVGEALHRSVGLLWAMILPLTLLLLGVLGQRVEGEGERLSFANVAVAARGEWPLVEASLLPVLCLLVGVIGVVKTETAVAIAIGAGVVELFGYGIAAGRRLELSLRGTIAVAVINGALGLLIVLLKVLVH